jgi:hypothetical protein
MYRLLSGLLGLIIFMGLAGASRAEDPAGTFDLRFSIAPYSRLTNENLQPLNI